MMNMYNFDTVDWGGEYDPNSSENALRTAEHYTDPLEILQREAEEAAEEEAAWKREHSL